MRITNSMVVNRMLLNMNRNITNIDKYYNQLSTTKKINVPSDDPILAARALKFRTSVSECEQYRRNVNQGLSWMDTTECAFTNTDSALLLLRNLAVSAASDEKTYDDRQKIVTQMEEIIAQIGVEMNVQYAGRYVFSGYRTDQPPVYEDDNNMSYNISQNFTAKDMEHTLSYQKWCPEGLPESHEVDILKLPYSNVDNLTFEVDLSPVQVVVRSLTGGDPDYEQDAYNVDGLTDTAVYIKETGELVLSSDVAQKVRDGGEVAVNYDKTGFKKDELNPMVYFNCKDLDTGKSYNMDNQNLEFEFGANTRIAVNSLAKDIYTDKMYADLKLMVDLVKNVGISDYDVVYGDIKLKNPGMSDEDIQQATETQLSQEKDLLNQILHDRFNNMIGIVDKHKSDVSVQHTEMGTRYNRLELIETRLNLDIITYKKLQSDNEDADLMEVAMYLSAAEAVYQASLKAGGSIIQQTLANYI